MTKFVRVNDLTENDKQEVAEMVGKIILWGYERRSIWYMADKLGLTPKELLQNICECLYVLRNMVGKRAFLKILFWK